MPNTVVLSDAKRVKLRGSWDVAREKYSSNVVSVRSGNVEWRKRLPGDDGDAMSSDSLSMSKFMTTSCPTHSAVENERRNLEKAMHFRLIVEKLVGSG